MSAPKTLKEQQLQHAEDAKHSEHNGGLCEQVKLVVATLVVLALLTVVFAGVSLGYCVLKLHPLINFTLMFGCLLMLAYVEALHYAVVSIEKWTDFAQYADSYPRAVKCHALVDTPQKVKKFLVGRQFFVIFVVFLLAQITSFPDIPHDWLGMPAVLVLLLLETGLPGVALTLTIGQLISQLFVEEFTLQFLNYYGNEFVIRLSLAVEWIGVCNFSWLLYAISSRLFCRKIRRRQKIMDREAAAGSSRATSRTDLSLSAPSSTRDQNNNNNNDDDEEMMSPTAQNRGPDYESGDPSEPLTFFDGFKYLWSTAATLGAIIVVCYGIGTNTYILPVPPAAAFIVAITLLVILFYLEGLMIAVVATQYFEPESFRVIYPRAYKVHQLMAKPDNVKRFIIGRQFFTVLTNFLLAQIFTFAYWDAGSYNPVLFFILIKSGLVGVLIILSFGQLMPELLAAEYPLRFLNMYGSYTICYISLVFDQCAVGHAAWTIYFVTRRLICSSQMGDDGKALEESKPEIVRVNSAEILVGHDRYLKYNGGKQLSALQNDQSPAPDAEEAKESSSQQRRGAVV